MLSKKQQQTFLKHHYGYYKGSIDGVIGSKTKTAIKAFQKANKLTKDGVWGKNTNSKSVSLVKTIQKKLNKVGYSCGDVDGIIGEKTISAIKKFQKTYKLTNDGIYGSKTNAKLNSVYATKVASETIAQVASKAVFSWQNTDGSINWEDVEKLGFKKSEFKCHCKGKYCEGYPANISIYLLNALINIRKKFGGTVTITSPLRCKTWNKKQGGVTNSKHTKGMAADIIVYDKNGKMVAQSKVKAYAKKQKNFNYSYYGTSGMGKATHIDFKK